MDDRDQFDQRITDFFTKDELHAKINRTYFGLELRITIDHLMNHTGAQLVNQQERSIDVHPKTVEYYFKLSSLIYDYTSAYGKNPDLEVLKNKWTTPARKAYFN